MRYSSSLVPRPSRAPARKRVWNLSQDFLALLNQHDDVYYVIQNDCHVLWVRAYGPIPMRAYVLRGGTTASRDRHKLLTHQAFAKAISIHFLSRCFETSCVSREAFLACL